MVVPLNTSIIDFCWFTLNYSFQALQHMVMLPVLTVSASSGDISCCCLSSVKLLYLNSSRFPTIPTTGGFLKNESAN